MTLKDLPIGKTATVCSVGGEGALRQHFLDMGLIPTADVTMVKYAPMGDPVEIEYTLNFSSETSGEKGQIPQEAAKKVLMIAAVLIVAGGILNHFVKKRRLGYTGRKK